MKLSMFALHKFILLLNNMICPDERVGILFEPNGLGKSR